MKRDFHATDAAEMLEVALQKLQTCDCRTMPVFRNGNLVGLLTMDNVGEFLSVQAALGRQNRGLTGATLDRQRLPRPG